MPENTNNEKNQKNILQVFSSPEELESYKFKSLMEYYKMSSFHYDIRKDTIYIHKDAMRLVDFTDCWFKLNGDCYYFEKLTERLDVLIRDSFLDHTRKAVEEARQNTSGTMITCDTPIIYREGNTRWTNFILDTILDENGVPVYIIGYCKDVHKEKKEMYRLRNVAQTDWLTGFRNRNGGLVKIQHKVEEDNNKTCFMAVIDLNKFKLANDLYGHAFGDIVLKSTADKIKDFFDHETICCRTGGDEFLFYRTCDDAEHAMDFVTKLKEHLEHTVTFETASFDVRASIGVVVCPLHGKKFDDLYNKADAAMYYAKNLELDKPVLYEEKMDSVWL